MLWLFNAPTVITNIKEIKAIYEKNETQGQQLKEAIQKVEANLSIDTATDELLTKWEQILNIQKLDIDSLEERRFRVKSKVFQKLPYSIRVVRKKLETLCGIGESALSVDYEKEEVLCQLHYVPNPFYRVIEQYLEDVIPMNLVISIWEYIDSKFKSEINIDGNLNIKSDFYPRGNFKFLMLDGTWLLNGTHTLNGYFDNHVIDFYPVQLEVSASIGVKKEISTLMETSSNAINEIQYEEELEIDSKINVEKQEESKLCLYSNTMLQIGIKSEVTIEKHIKYLDGTWLLNGTKLLDAEIINLEL